MISFKEQRNIMNEEVKKAIMLLKSLILHYHGLDEDEKEILEAAAARYDAEKEMQWANDFISSDYLSAHDRAREFLMKIFLKMTKEKRLEQLSEIWEENYEKGYVTEMETTALLNFAKDWKIESLFMKTLGD
jgi:hypothetical protein